MEFLQPLGVVVQGSLSQGLEVRLNGNISVEELRVGKFLVVQGRRARFFCILTDVTLGTSSPRILLNPPAPEDTFLTEVLSGNGTFAVIKLTPMLMYVPANPLDLYTDTTKKSKRKKVSEPLPQLFESENYQLLPVKTVPSHFSQVFEAKDHDFQVVFGAEDHPHKRNFAIGKPIDMDVPVCIDLDRFVERSNGIFGKSGTGKSFLTRLLIAGIIKRRAAVNLIFDMHSEYGWEAAKEGKTFSTVKGLRQLFPSQVIVYTLDPDSTKRRGVRDARELYISFEQIEVEDLMLVKDELNLSEASLENAIILRNEFGKHWITKLQNMTNNDIQEFCEEKMGNKASIMALQRKLNRLADIKYLRSHCHENYIQKILEAIAQHQHVVIEFGSQSNLLAYMLATNIITRRIHHEYVHKVEKFLQTKNLSDRPPQLMITIEEAHRFLNPLTAKQTIFGTIAREMRKYFVTLLVVDQRPSGIDNEIMSQIGTRITALLNDEKDIDAIFTGIAGSGELRNILSKLDSKQQALVLGHAVPMPVVVQTRSYDAEFYRQVGETSWETQTDQEVLEMAQVARLDLGI
ncbi:MAG: helicase HerA domain-containing protein [Pseudanabaenaceae cyanobacterium]